MTSAEFASIRKRAGMTQSALASALRLGPNGPRYIRAIEMGEKEPSGPICLLMELIDEGIIQ